MEEENVDRGEPPIMDIAVQPDPGRSDFQRMAPPGSPVEERFLALAAVQARAEERARQAELRCARLEERVRLSEIAEAAAREQLRAASGQHRLAEHEARVRQEAQAAEHRSQVDELRRQLGDVASSRREAMGFAERTAQARLEALGLGYRGQIEMLQRQLAAADDARKCSEDRLQEVEQAREDHRTEAVAAGAQLATAHQRAEEAEAAARAIRGELDRVLAREGVLHQNYRDAWVSATAQIAAAQAEIDRLTEIVGGLRAREASLRVTTSTFWPLTRKRAAKARRLVLQAEAEERAELLARADRLRDAGRSAEAAQAYEAYLAHDPDRTGIRVQFANMLKDSGQLARAERMYRRALVEQPGEADTHLQLGHALKLQDRLQEALASYQAAQEGLPANAELSALVAELERRVAVTSPPPARSGAAPLDGTTAARRRSPAFPPVLRQPRPLPDVFVWGIIDWHFRMQRPQHLSLNLARSGHRTFYFSNAFVGSAEPGFRIEPLSDDGLLNVVHLHVEGTPSIYLEGPSPRTEAAIRASLAQFLQHAAPSAIVSLVQHPFWTAFADAVPNRTLVYDMMDHHEGFGDNAPDIIALEDKLLREADHVVVTSAYLEDVARARNSAVTVVRNACEYEHFAIEPAAVFRDGEGRRIIGYYGAIAHWFDAELVARVAEAFPGDLLLLVGDDSAGVGERLRRYPNVRMVGECSYASLPYYLHAFDVCLLPFKVVPLTLATNPVKVYEYLSAGKPVVAVDLPEMGQFAGLVEVAGDTGSFLRKLEAQLGAAGRDPGRAEERRRFAAGQTWSDRCASLSKALRELPLPRVSVVVVTFDKLEMTRACLHSLELNSHYPNMEVIVIDNASTDGTRAYLEEWRAQATNRKVVLNEENRGFSAANNQGIVESAGEYVVLLNNDTYVTPGWVGSLVRHLRRDHHLGLVGPVTNNIGNEARIGIAYGPMDEMERAALGYTSAHLGETLDMRTVAFFCVALPRTTIDEVGLLDEAFGIGMFEDDDYCRRVEQAGLRVACAEDVFVHHHHSASFDALPSAQRAELFAANRKTYEAKWGEWLPHSYRAETSDPSGGLDRS